MPASWVVQAEAISMIMIIILPAAVLNLFAGTVLVLSSG
jgi:hypothetical protein